MSRESWPRSKRAVLGMGVTPNPTSTASDEEIQAIANMMDDVAKPNIKSAVPMSHGLGVRMNITPEDDAQRMIQNYVKRNGSIILD